MGRQGTFLGARGVEHAGRPAREASLEERAAELAAEMAVQQAAQARVEADLEARQAAARAALRDRQVAMRQSALSTPLVDGQVVAAVRQPAESLGAVLQYADRALEHFAVWPSEHARRMALLWAAAAHGRADSGQPVWQYAPRLAVLSPKPGGGKSWVLRQVMQLVPDGKRMIEPTAAAVARNVGSAHKTVFLDEADILFGAGQRKSDLRSILNGGYEPDGTFDRASGGSGTGTSEIPVFGFLGFAGLSILKTSTGDHLKAMLDRCLFVHMRKAPAGYRPPRLDDRARSGFEELRNRLAGWMAYEVRNGIAQVIPEVPEGLGNRPCALWEPLFSVADAAGGDWPAWAREACVELESSDGLPDTNPDAWADFTALADSWTTADD
jgi:Protein of unknown function (DUF3631)